MTTVQSKSALQNGAKRLMLYKDGRFAKHKMFPFYVYNMIVRHRNKATSNFFVNGFGTNGISSVSELQERIAKGDTNVVSKISYISKSIVGSDGYYRQKKAELNSWIAHHIDCGNGPPNFFFTLSCAEYYWPDLIRLVNERIGIATGIQGTLEVSKPGIVSAMTQ